MTQRNTHEVTVDGKTGPWNRTRHRHRRGEQLLLDNRCGRCKELIEGLLDLELQYDRPLYTYGLRTVRSAERTLDEAKAGGNYGAGI